MSATAYINERWFVLLKKAVDDANDENGRGGISKIAKRLSISRTQVSLVLAGKYENPATIKVRVMNLLDIHHCPYLGLAIQNEQCLEVAAGPAPTWDPAAMEQRRTCQSCPHKPEGDRK